MSTFDRAMERAAQDRDFRAQLLEDTDAALQDYHLQAGERERLLQEAELIEARIQQDPLEATEADHGQADAASLKG